MGINFYDHATCYGEGEAESRFGDALRNTGINLYIIVTHTLIAGDEQILFAGEWQKRIKTPIITTGNSSVPFRIQLTRRCNS